MTLPTIQRNGSSGDAVIFLHGIGGNAASWQPQLSVFGENFQAIAWNMPGYSESPALPEMTFPALADSLETLLDTLALSQVHLVGHSMGGMVAQEFLLQRQHRVKSLVLYATSPAFGKTDGVWQQEFIKQRLKPLDHGGTMADVAQQMAATLLGDKPDPAGVKLAHASIADCNPTTYRAALQCLVTFDRRTHLPNIQIPTLVLAGEKDTVSAAPMMEKMASKIPGAQFHTIAKAGHLIHLEQPAPFNEAVQQFIQANLR